MISLIVVSGFFSDFIHHLPCSLNITSLIRLLIFGILGRSYAEHCSVIPAVKCIIIDTYISAIGIHLHDIKKTHGLTACLLKAAAK